MNRFITALAVVISLLFATDLFIIHTTDGDSLTFPLSQIETLTFSTVSDTTYMTDGNSLNVPLSQIERISFSAVTDTTPPEGAIEIFPGDDINSIVDNNPEGTTFIIKSGIHRMQEIWPKNGNTFWGESGAILNGSKELTEFEQEGGLYYAPDQTQEAWYGSTDMCLEGWERCYRPEDLFFDSEPLRHVTSLDIVESGEWFFDYDADRIYFADDPEGHTIETSITTMAIHNSGSDVTLKNLLIEKYAIAIPSGAVGCCEPEPVNWLLENNEIRLNHGAGVVVGPESIVTQNYIHHNGHLGIAGIGNNILVEANEISYNNYTHADFGIEGGGTKFTNTDGIEIIGNYSHHNLGPGLWTDYENYNVVYDGNWVWWNYQMGISHEVSHNVIIRNNDVRYNGINDDAWLWGSQILIHVSDEAEIYDNTVYIHAEGGNGIGIINYNRADSINGDWYSKDNTVHDNEITYLGMYGASGIVDGGEEGTDYYLDSDNDGLPDWGCFAESANNLFDYNIYHHNGIPEKFEFCGWSYLSLEQFQSEGHEIHGTMDSNVIVPDDTPPQVCPICPGI